MKKIIFINFVLILIFLFSLNVKLSVVASNDEQKVTTKDVIQSRIVAHHNRRYYNGEDVGTKLKPEDLVEISIDSHGGIMEDEHGTLCFGNYANVSLKLKANEDMRIPGKNTEILYDNSSLIAGRYIGMGTNQKLKALIGYGVILQSKHSANGNSRFFEEVYLRNNDDKLNAVRITEDADYKFTILLFILEGTVKKEVEIEFIIPIRTNIFVTDEFGDYHVKDAGAYYKAIKLDALNRPGVSIFVDGQQVPDGTVLFKYKKYKIEVYANGYKCETFEFILFNAISDSAHVYLANSRKQIDSISYECEGYFKVDWYCEYNCSMKYWKNGDPKTEYSYTKDTKIDEPGVYVFTLTIPALNNTNMTFLVSLVKNDEPVVNYNTLYTNRFNNFKTKWYEVYDDVSNHYYCFSMNEYNYAYESAMSVEYKKVDDYGHYFVYKEKQYTNKTLLSNDMAKAAEQNLKVVYYDPTSEQVEKYFSDLNFDGTVYLNHDFEFVRTIPSESNEVTMISENGESIKIDFFTPLSSYNLNEGKYKIIEKDLYGNTTEYEGIIDKSSPEINLKLNDVSINVKDKEMYSCRYFTLIDLFDKYDDYAVISVEYENNGNITKNYYYQEEANNEIFSLVGKYSISLYDRNNNIINFMVEIPENKQYYLKKDNGNIMINLINENIIVTSIQVNGEFIEFNEQNSYTFAQDSVDKEYIIYTKNQSTGEVDVASFTIFGLQNEDSSIIEIPNEQLNYVSGEGALSFNTALTIIICTFVVAILVCIFIVNKIWRVR